MIGLFRLLVHVVYFNQHVGAAYSKVENLMFNVFLCLLGIKHSASVWCKLKKNIVWTAQHTNPDRNIQHVQPFEYRTQWSGFRFFNLKILESENFVIALTLEN